MFFIKNVCRGICALVYVYLNLIWQKTFSFDTLNTRARLFKVSGFELPAEYLSLTHPQAFLLLLNPGAAFSPIPPTEILCRLKDKGLNTVRNKLVKTFCWSKRKSGLHHMTARSEDKIKIFCLQQLFLNSWFVASYRTPNKYFDVFFPVMVRQGAIYLCVSGNHGQDGKQNNSSNFTDLCLVFNSFKQDIDQRRGALAWWLVCWQSNRLDGTQAAPSPFTGRDIRHRCHTAHTAEAWQWTRLITFSICIGVWFVSLWLRILKKCIQLI